jgi:hypothetical protein
MIELDLDTAARAHALAATSSHIDEKARGAVVGGTVNPPSFDSLPNTIERNVIVGNFGASQGVDNDDGSRCAPLIHSSHTLLSYTPLIHSSHTLLSYTLPSSLLV